MKNTKGGGGGVETTLYGQILSETKRKKCCQWSDTTQAVEFLQQVRAMMSENPEKSIMAIAEQLQAAVSTARLSTHDVTRHHSLVIDLLTPTGPA